MADTASLFTMGDVVLQNPKEAGGLFAIVVVLCVALESIIGAFRENRSRYVKLLFLQISEEIMIVGVIGLCFVFVSQSISTLPLQWLILLRWIQTVLFFLMVFFIIGIVTAAYFSLAVVNRFTAEELAAQHLEEANNAGTTTTVVVPEGVDLTMLQRLYFVARADFVGHVRTVQDKARADFEHRAAAARASGAHQRANRNKDDALQEPPYIAALSSVTLVEYLKERAKDTVVKYTDISWQCWFSIVLLTTINSLRLFMLPGDLQNKNSSQFTEGDHALDAITYIFVIGWIPAMVFIVGFICLVRNCIAYLNQASADLERNAALEGGDEVGGDMLTMSQPSSRVAPRTKIRGSSVWLPPKDLTAMLMGRAAEDPSVYFLRGNRAFTLHILKIPSLLAQLYLAMFIVGQWGEISQQLDSGRQAYLVICALIPPFTVITLMPFALAIVAVLSSLGSRLDEGTLVQLARRIVVQANGGTDEEIEAVTADSDGVALANELATMELLAKATASGGSRDNAAVADKLDRLEQLVTRMTSEMVEQNGGSGGGGGFDLDGAPPTVPRRPGWNQERNAANEIAALKARVRFLEDLCINYGLPIVPPGADGTAIGADAHTNSLGHVCTSLTKLHEVVGKLAETQQQIVSASNAVRTPGSPMAGLSSPVSTANANAGIHTMLDAYSSSRRGAVASPAGPVRPAIANPAPAPFATSFVNATRDISRVRSSASLL